eukprot:TRINITY_DN2669_c0_g1_i1.p1 TRINITY_DN2669_c0_g1~~TRINITY_DN2669_c0_g1_i1.p1  ORF type:complete len:952 (+),score=150.53 TRINITY_DN2669_c0_g1_i1:1413-4268(+)
MSVQLLPDDDALLIRAAISFQGVDDAVKELVENSIAAGASEIVVAVNSCSEFSVWDNGSGISAECMAQIGNEGWTTKPNGKGNALSHLAALSNGVVISSNGLRKTIGSTTQTVPSSEQVKPGSLITVIGFLERIPVRSKVLLSSKSPTTKTLVQVRSTLIATYLCNRNLKFQLLDSTGSVRSTFNAVTDPTPQTNIAEAWQQLFPHDTQMILSSMETFTDQTSCISASGYWSNTASSLTKGKQYLCVNGIPGKCTFISHVINTMYKRACKDNDVKRFSMRGRRYPSFFVDIKCPPQYVDVTTPGNVFNMSVKNSQQTALLLMRILTQVLEQSGHTVPTCLGLYQGIWLSTSTDDNTTEEVHHKDASMAEVPIDDVISRSDSAFDAEPTILKSTQLVPDFVNERTGTPTSTGTVECEICSTGSTDNDILLLEVGSDGEFVPEDISRNSLPDDVVVADELKVIEDTPVSRSSIPSILAANSFDDDILAMDSVSLSSPVQSTGGLDTINQKRLYSDSIEETIPDTQDTSPEVDHSAANTFQSISLKRQKVTPNPVHAMGNSSLSSSIPLIYPSEEVDGYQSEQGSDPSPIPQKIGEIESSPLSSSPSTRISSSFPLFKKTALTHQSSDRLLEMPDIKRPKVDLSEERSVDAQEAAHNTGKANPETEEPVSCSFPVVHQLDREVSEVGDEVVNTTSIPTYAPNMWRRWFDNRTTVSSKNDQIIRHHQVRRTDITKENIQVIGQACSQFILCMNVETQQLYAVDQHAADERVKLEVLQSTLFDMIGTKKVDATTIQATDGEILAALQCDDEMRRFGWAFTIEEDRIIFSGVPKISFPEWVAQPRTVEISAASAVQAALEMSSSGKAASLVPSVITKILASKACRSAVMFGDPLTLDSCQSLIESLTTTLDPFHCAHGRPAIAPLSTPPAVPQHVKPSYWNLMARKKPALFRLVNNT